MKRLRTSWSSTNSSISNRGSIAAVFNPVIYPPSTASATEKEFDMAADGSKECFPHQEPRDEEYYEEK